MKAPKPSLKGSFVLSSLAKILLATASCSGTLRPRGLNPTQQIVAESTVRGAQSRLCRTDQCLLPLLPAELPFPAPHRTVPTWLVGPGGDFIWDEF